MIEQETAITFEARLESMIVQATERSRELRRPVLVSITEELEHADPLRMFQHSMAFASERWFWEHPTESLAIVGVGVASGTIPPWRVRFPETESVYQGLNDSAVVYPDVGPDNPGPTYFSAFSFDPERKPDLRVWRGFPSSYLLLPRVTLVQRDGRNYLTCNLLATPNREPATMLQLTFLFRERIFACFEKEIRAPQTHVDVGMNESSEQRASAFVDAVGQARNAIRDGAFDKVVLARRRDIKTSDFYNIPRAIERLRSDYPGCYTFAVARHSSIFLGATPERLVRLEGKNVTTACLAGSIRRGATPEEDSCFGQQLLGSDKDRHEHEITVRAIREAIEPVCDRLDIPDEPELMTVSNVHHLHTPVRGHLNNGTTLFRLVERLHPTPAVGGYPKDVARDFIRENEGMDRGWYAAPIGWIDSQGNGEFAVALRSAVIRGQNGHLFAGCGIVANSDPEQELAESELKLKPMLAAVSE